MEEFTRECLEIDTEAENTGPPALLKTVSMDKVYERAAKLVKRTLDVEGAVVMDVSHFAVLESVKAEGSIAVVMHNGESQANASSYSIPTEEYEPFLDFFKKNTEGKIVEGIMPKCFRTLLPIRVQHALRKFDSLSLCGAEGSNRTQSFPSSTLTSGLSRSCVHTTLQAIESHS